MFSRRFLIGATMMACISIPMANSHVLADEEQARVTGAILLDGKPVGGGRIIFYSQNDQFVGSKIKDGGFKIDRVAVGDYEVAIEYTGVPAKYSSEKNSGLKVTVKAASNDFRFSLTSN